MNLTQSVGAAIRRNRLIKNCKQSYLAKAIGISPQTLSLLENGKADISLKKLEQIAALLEVDVRQFFAVNTLEQEDRQIFETTTIRLVNMYNDLLQHKASEQGLVAHVQMMIHMLQHIVEILGSEKRQPYNA